MYPLWVIKSIHQEDSVKTLKVLAVQTNWMISRGFSRLLGEELNLNLAECETKDLHELANEISCFEPDVILISDSSALFVEDLLVPMLEIFPSLRVIVVQENSNWLNIYSSKIINTTHVLDLKKVIEADWYIPTRNYK
jgi:hypothetical protein